MDLEVLVATMNQKDHSLLEKMNIQSDAIVGNQCERNDIEDFLYNGHRIKYLSFAEKGVGLNRNNALMRATADICVIADDDIIFNDNYVDAIKRSFEENPAADVIIFNLYRPKKNNKTTKKKYRVRYHNFMKFGATRIAIRRKSITMKGINFNLHFGGGAEYSAGEDTLFILDCLKNKLKVIAVPEHIAQLTDFRKSTWFNGYTEKYFIDKGVLFASISARFSLLLCLQFLLRHRKMYNSEMNIKQAFRLMYKGTEIVRNKTFL